MVEQKKLMIPPPITTWIVFVASLNSNIKQKNFQARKFHGSNESIVSQLVSQPLSVHIHHPVLQPSLPNPCKENHCDHLCLLSPSANKGYICKCRPGFRLVEGSECRESENPYLIVVKKSQIVDLSTNPDDDTDKVWLRKRSVSYFQLEHEM